MGSLAANLKGYRMFGGKLVENGIFRTDETRYRLRKLLIFATETKGYLAQQLTGFGTLRPPSPYPTLKVHVLEVAEGKLTAVASL